MKALHFDGKSLCLTEKEIPRPGKGESLIKIRYAGICNTDLEILKGYMAFTGTIGHEFVGTVEKSGNPDLIGKRVVGEINLACGKCEFCLQGLDRHCPNRTVLGIAGKDGALAEYVTLPDRNLHVVPPEVSDLKAVFTEPLAAACEITEQLQILPEYRVLVLGDGKLAQLIARVLSIYTDKLLVVGKHLHKLKLLKDLEITGVVLSEFKEKEQSFHLVVEATGSWEGWETALRFVRPRGFLVLKSTYAGEHIFNPAPLVINEITVVGSRCGPFIPALQLLKRGAVDPSDLVQKIYRIDEWEEAFRLAQDPKSLKVLIEF